MSRRFFRLLRFYEQQNDKEEERRTMNNDQQTNNNLDEKSQEINGNIQDQEEMIPVDDSHESAKVNEESDSDEVEIVDEIIHPPIDEDSCEMREGNPLIVNLEDAPNEGLHRLHGCTQELMRHLEVENNPIPSMKIRFSDPQLQLPIQLTFSTPNLNGRFTESYAREYCEWYEKCMHPFLQKQMKPYLEFYEYCKSNSRKNDNVNRAPVENETTADCSTQTDDILLEKANINSDESYSKIEQNPPMNIEGQSAKENWMCPCGENHEVEVEVATPLQELSNINDEILNDENIDCDCSIVDSVSGADTEVMLWMDDFEDPYYPVMKDENE